MNRQLEKMENHCIIFGYGYIGQRIKGDDLMNVGDSLIVPGDVDNIETM